MKSKTNYFLIGVFVLTGIGLASAAVLVLGTGGLGGNVLTVESYFNDSVSGLSRGAVVTFRGVRVGQVTEIELASNLYPDTRLPYVVVRSAIRGLDPSTTPERLTELIENRVAQGFRVRLANQGLTGSLYLESDLMTDADQRFPPYPIDFTPEYPYVPSAPSTIAQLSSAVDEVLTMLRETDLPGAADEFKSAMREMKQAVADLDVPTLSRRADDALLSAREMIDQLHSDLRSLADRTGSLVHNGDTLIGELRDSLDLDKIEKILADLAVASEGIDPAITDLRETLTVAQQTLGDIGTQVRSGARDVDSILDRVRDMSAHLADLANTLERYPSLMLFGTAPPDRRPSGR